MVNLFLDLAPAEELNIVIQPLVALATCDRRETKFLSMNLLSQLTLEYPHLIAPYAKYLNVFWADPEPLALIKISTLATIATGATGKTLICLFYLQHLKEVRIKSSVSWRPFRLGIGLFWPLPP